MVVLTDREIVIGRYCQLNGQECTFATAHFAFGHCVNMVEDNFYVLFNILGELLRLSDIETHTASL